jgi:hypothetical protein
MTPDEQQMLADLASKIAQTPTPPRDPEAEDFIRTKIGNRPDALYLMTQTVLIQNLALQQAQAQLQQLQRSPGGSSSSFLGGTARPGGYSQPSVGQQQQYSAPPPPPPQYGAPAGSAPSGAGSFLRGAAQTAAGVAAGTLAVQGIESLFSHGGGGGFLGGGGGYAPPVDETVVNNYYDSPGGDDRGGDYGRDDYQATDDATQYDDSGAGYDDGGGFDDNSGGDNFV